MFISVLSSLLDRFSWSLRLVNYTDLQSPHREEVGFVYLTSVLEEWMEMLCVCV